MTTTTPAGSPAISARIHTLNRPNMVSVGVIVWLSSELMFFAGLFGIYFTARAVSDTWPPANVDLDMWFDLIFTIILVLSSFTCQFGVWAAERGDVFGLRRWYIVTFLMGLTFIIGQSSEFLTMVHEGTTLQSGAYGTVFYLTTGFHGLHVVGGLIAFILMIARTKMAKFTPAQASSSIVVSYYWHFVDVIWIALFTTIFIIR